MYPSIMRGFGIDPSRLVRLEFPGEVAAAEEQGVVVTGHEISPGKVVQFAVPSCGGQGPFAQILSKLLSERAAVRKLEGAEQDKDKKAVLNARQMAKKVAANSAYGLFGASKGYLPLSDIAATTTYLGRQILAHTQKVAEERFGCSIVAGDTVRRNVELSRHPPPF